MGSGGLERDVVLDRCGPHTFEHWKCTVFAQGPRTARDRVQGAGDRVRHSSAHHEWRVGTLLCFAAAARLVDADG